MYEGVVNILKPPGMTSSDVVSDLRKVFGMKRVGHTGTLDPGAAGVLPVCIGRATRLFDYLVDKEKEYIAELRLGISTDTQDSYGEITARGGFDVDRADVERALEGFIGTQMQTAPIYSALNEGGVKLYKLAREGKEISPKVREITVSQLELLSGTGEGRYLLRIVCSRGTYVRTLCHDIGAKLKIPAHLSFLLRTRSGSFGIEDAYSIAELWELRERGALGEAVVSMEQALMHIGEARMTLNSKGERFLRHGAEVVFDGVGALPIDTPLRAYCNSEFVGIAKSNGEALHITAYLGEEDI